MNEDEKHEFKTDITSQVQKIVDDGEYRTAETIANFNNDIGVRLEKTLPNILNKTFKKDNRLFILLNSIINGVVVGITIYAAIYIVGK